MYELLNINNYQIPSVGLGLWKINKLDTANVVTNAIEIGYRHLDSAADYGNEKEVGAGLAEAINKGYCGREEVWITSIYLKISMFILPHQACLNKNLTECTRDGFVG